MHWFWRVTIAAIFTELVVWLCTIGSWVSIYISAGEAMNADGVFLRDELINFSDLVIENLWTASVTLPFFVLPIAVYALLTRAYGPQKMLEQETLCRKCGYILKGITEPICSECGEKI